MKASEGRIGRVFVLRLDDGDALPGCVEQFALDRSIEVAQVTLLGGIGRGEVVVGPRHSDEMPPQPVQLPVDGAHEVVGVGLIAPGEDGRPALHIHAALGRSGRTLTGCLRPGVSTWLVGEVVITEITDVPVVRRHDSASGFALLEVPAT